MKILQNLALAGAIAMAVTAWSGAASSEPIELILTNWARSQDEGLSTWAEEVTRDSGGTISVTYHDRSSPLGSDPRAQITQLQNGESDIAVFYPSYFPESFPDADIGYMPGVFDNPVEASIALLRLIEQGTMRGFDDLYVLSSWVSGDNIYIHSNFPIDDLGMLSGSKIRIAAKVVEPMVEVLGAEAVFMPVSKARAALEEGEVDAVLVGWGATYTTNLMDVLHHHLAVPMGNIVYVVAMKRDRFDSLPEAAKAALLVQMGEVYAGAAIQRAADRNRRLSDDAANRPDHYIRALSDSQREIWLTAAQNAIDVWVEADPYRQTVLDAALDEAKRIRVGQ